jgi:hypothetical protein
MASILVVVFIFLLIFLLIESIPQCAYAQEEDGKISPDAAQSHGEDRADDTETEPTQPSAGRPTKKRLTIPDIVIYGKDKTYIFMDQKEFPLQRDPAFPPDMARGEERSLPEDIFTGKKHHPRSEPVQFDTSEVTGRAIAGYGTGHDKFHSPRFSLYNRHDVTFMEYELRFSFKSNSGHVDDSEYRMYDVGLGIIPSLKNIRPHLDFDIFDIDYELWGTTHTLKRRDFGEKRISLKLSGDVDITPSLLYHASFSGGHFSLVDDPESATYDFDVRSFDSDAGFLSNWKELTFRGNTCASFESFDVPAQRGPHLGERWNWDWDLGLDYGIGQRYIVSLVAGGTTADLYGTTDFSEIYAHVRIAAIVKEGLTLALSYEPSVEFHDVLATLMSNKFYDFTNGDTGTPFYPLPVWRSFDVGLEGNFTGHGSEMLQFELRFSRYDELPFWTDADGDGLFDLETFNEVEEIRYSLSSTIPIGADWTLVPNLIGNYPLGGESGDVSGEFDNVKKIPYRALFTGNVTIGYAEPERGFTSDLNFHLFTRWFPEDGQKLSMDTVFLADFDLEKRLLSWLSFWMQLENILGTEYQVWEGYSMPGITLVLGLKGKW